MHERRIEARGAGTYGGTVAARPELDFELVDSDGEPLDSEWQRLEIHLFTEVIKTTMAGRGRHDFFTGGDMFVYYDPAQARGIATDPGTREHYKGPDIFYVSGVEPGCRDYWVTWEEGRYPEVIVELVSPSTEKADRGTKKRLYERTFRTPEYYLYDRRQEKLEGLRLGPGGYGPIRATAEGRLWSQQLQAYLGLWQGTFSDVTATWIRLFDREGQLLPTEAEQERQRAEQERQRAEAAEAEIARLRAELARRT